MQNVPLKNFQFAKVKVKESSQLETVRDVLIGQGFLVSALSDTIDQANKIFSVIQIVLGVFGVVALVVAKVIRAHLTQVTITT